MGELVYIDEMAGKKTERLQIVLSPEDLSQLDEWRRQQPDIPNRSEAVRRLIGMQLSPEAWRELHAEAEKVDVDALSDGRLDFLMGTALAWAVSAMSSHPQMDGSSDMVQMYALLTKRYPNHQRGRMLAELAKERFLQQ